MTAGSFRPPKRAEEESCAIAAKSDPGGRDHRLLTFSVLGSSVSAASPKAFHLTKTCVSNVLCTVATDDFKAIPAGTDVTYTWGSATIAYPTIVVRNGSTTGVCDWNQPAGPVLAKCTFGTGTGRLTQFSLAVDVTFDGTYWHWDGWYWFGGGD